MSYVEVCKKHGQYHGELCGECFYELQEQLDATLTALKLTQQENKQLRIALQKVADEGPASSNDKKHQMAKEALQRL